MTGVCALIPAAGRGVRFGSGGNKVFAPLLGRPLLGWTVEAFARCDAVDQIVLIGGEEDLPRLRAVGSAFGAGKEVRVVPGGANRQASVWAGLSAAAQSRLPDGVVVHDGARPCVTPAIIRATLDAVRDYGATAAVPVADTLVRGTGDEGPGRFASDAVERAGLHAVQTPQAFQTTWLTTAHRLAERDGFQGTDDAGLVQRLMPGQRVIELAPGSPENIKVTRPEDLALAEAILARRHAIGAAPQMRIGHGYDVHAFAEGRRLFLGGVAFPDAPRGLLGHSDADVVLHAVCDALLGAAGMGDIGTLFPDTEAAHKDRPSLEFLNEVAARLRDAGCRVANIDITVLAESPKIGPRAAAMKEKISAALGIAPEQVGVKATTNEGMGFVGRGEGIAAHAAALIYR